MSFKPTKKTYSGKAVSPEVIANNHTTTQVVHHQQIHSGPIPSPAILKEYDNIIPGSAERILQMAEKDAQHQRDISLKALNAERLEHLRGQYLGFGIGGAALLTSIVAMIFGHPSTASIIGGTTVVGLVTVFVIGRKAP